MKEKIFLTTTLPYANSYNGHIGHLFEFVLADCLSRFLKNRFGDDNVFFNTGLDQNGTKILNKAKELNLNVDEYLKIATQEWKSFCQKFNINYDNFYETSSKEHYQKVQQYWNYFVDNNDIFENDYIGNYCTGCESYKLDKDLIDNVCPDHKNLELLEIKERNYFFDLYKYEEILISWMETKPLYPDNKLKTLFSFIEDYKNISVSRKKSDITLGIDVPYDDSQIVYIWLDALMNYPIAASAFKNWDDCHIIQLFGNDNLRFQGQIFQTFLSALNLHNTDVLFMHGTVLDKNGNKMSKTMGNVVEPLKQLEKYGLSAVRYYTVAGLNTFDDSSWDEEKLIEQFNSDICDNYGNLIARVLHLIDTKLNGETTAPTIDFKDIVDNEYNEIYKCWQYFNIKNAYTKTSALIKIGNKYITDTQPWNNPDKLQILSNLYYLLIKSIDLYSPIFPHINLKDAITNKKKVILFEKLK